MTTELPVTSDAWVDEIARAFLDAVQVIPFGPAVGVEIETSDLYQLAPLIALKFRGLRATRKRREAAAEAALTSYVANLEDQPSLNDPLLAFTFCYLAAHFGLGLLSESEVEATMQELVGRRRDVQKAVDRELARFQSAMKDPSGRT